MIENNHTTKNDIDRKTNNGKKILMKIMIENDNRECIEYEDLDICVVNDIKIS